MLAVTEGRQSVVSSQGVRGMTDTPFVNRLMTVLKPWMQFEYKVHVFFEFPRKTGLRAEFRPEGNASFLAQT